MGETHFTEDDAPAPSAPQTGQLAVLPQRDSSGPTNPSARKRLRVSGSLAMTMGPGQPQEDARALLEALKSRFSRSEDPLGRALVLLMTATELARDARVVPDMPAPMTPAALLDYAAAEATVARDH